MIPCTINRTELSPPDGRTCEHSMYSNAKWRGILAYEILMFKYILEKDA
jgi:hypothetical protein